MFALICTWGVCVDNHFQMHFGSGEHPYPKEKAVTPAFTHYQLVGSAKSWYTYQILYLADLAIIKFSVLFFYLSIATQRTFRVLVIISMVVVALFSIALIMANAIECPRKPSLALSPGIFVNRKKWQCYDLVPLYFVAAAFNIFSDAFILLLPLPVLFKLRMPTLKRISLLILFSIGILVPIASGIRLWGILLWAKSGNNARYYGAYVVFWSQVELNTAIICASAPSLQPLIKNIFGKLNRRFSRSAYYYYGDGTHSLSDLRRPRRPRDPNSLSDLDNSLPGTYQPKTPHRSTEHELVIVKEFKDEEEIRDRVRHFASQRSSAQSQLPKSPARAHDTLASG